MGTHCHLGISTETHGIIGCHVHFDGYPSNMVPTLRAFLKKRTPCCLMLLIRQAQLRSGMRSFNPEGVELNDGMWGPQAYNDDDFGDSVRYRYLVDMETGELVAEHQLAHTTQTEWVQIKEEDWND